jgi:hypothetical protein
MQGNELRKVSEFLDGSYYCTSGVIITPNIPDGPDLIIVMIDFGSISKLLPTDEENDFSDLLGQFIVDAIKDKIAKEKISRNKIDIQVT